MTRQEIAIIAVGSLAVALAVSYRFSQPEPKVSDQPPPSKAIERLVGPNVTWTSPAIGLVNPGAGVSTLSSTSGYSTMTMGTMLMPAPPGARPCTSAVTASVVGVDC